MGYILEYILIKFNSLQQGVILVDLIKSKINVIDLLGQEIAGSSEIKKWNGQ